MKYKGYEEINGDSGGLTLTWDVLKFRNIYWWSLRRKRLTLTWDVLKYIAWVKE